MELFPRHQNNGMEDGNSFFGPTAVFGCGLWHAFSRTQNRNKLDF